MTSTCMYIYIFIYLYILFLGVHCSNSHEFPLGAHLCGFQSLSPKEKNAHAGVSRGGEGGALRSCKS